MQETKSTPSTSWVEQLEVTSPIKSIMGFVDELSLNYERRIAAMQTDYQKDIEEIIVCYKEEKQEFESQIKTHQQAIENLTAENQLLQQSFKVLNVENKMTKESLDTAKQELAELTKELKKEEELIAIAKAKIEAVKLQIESKTDLQPQEINGTPIPVKSSKAKDFFKLIIESRLSRTALAKPEKYATPIEQVEIKESKDTFSY